MSRKFRTKEWAIMMFIANDNDLDQFTRDKIAEINSVGSTRAADVILQFDTRGESFIRRMRLSKGQMFRLRALQKETNTGDKRTLIRFADLTLEDFHPHRAMLVISNHGSGFDIAGDQGIGRATSRKTETRAPIFWAATTRTTAFAVLEASGGSRPADTDTLDLLELKAAMRSIARRHGRIELLVFDACLMGTVEVAYQLRNTARVMVASQSNIPVPGCRFASTFGIMRDETLPTDAAAKALVLDVTPVVVDEYSAMASVDLDRADELAEAISVLADTLLAALDNDATALRNVTRAHLSALRFLDSDTIDLFDFCQRLLARMQNNEDVREAAADVQEAVEHFVLHANPCGTVVEGARGISITLPRRRDAISAAYRQLDFAGETSWMAFLDAYLPKAFPPVVDAAL
ncbi:MAG: clostripain-related cysteine peptidase [Thermoanaerobaculia bacterium]